MHIAIITAGGAGMFCGSCMHDNTWARALMEAGAEVSLIPTYTPIRVDEADVSEPHVYMGGLNVYLNHKSKLWRRLPRVLTRWLDRPGIIRWATSRSISNDPSELGDLTLDMLAGESGPLSRAVDELAQHIATLNPDAVIFSNALLVGALRRIKERYDGPVFCTLQGDDVFIDGLPDSHKDPAIAAIADRAQQFDGFFTHSAFYRDHMADYFRLPIDRFHLLPLGIDLCDHDGLPRQNASPPLAVGYFARITPEKGLHHLVDAALLLHQRRPGDVQIKVGGYLGPQQADYFTDVVRSAAPLGDAFDYIGSPDTLADKVAFYQSLDVLSVPTDFLEPKGLYVLEALANGVPVIQPAHGAFPELIEATEGGILVEPKDSQALADAIEHLLDEPDTRHALATAGHANVHDRFHLQRMADVTLSLLKQMTK